MNPYNEWTYREIDCKVFKIDDIEMIGYAKFGDEWIRIVEDDNCSDIMVIMDKVEDEVDRVEEILR